MSELAHGWQVGIVRGLACPAFPASGLFSTANTQPGRTRVLLALARIPARQLASGTSALCGSHKYCCARMYLKARHPIAWFSILPGGYPTQMFCRLGGTKTGAVASFLHDQRLAR